jgi:hypothetical protein
MRTRNLVWMVIAAAFAANGPALAQTGPLDDAPPSPASSFSSQDSPNFSPAAATAGTADAGHQLSTIETRLKNCSALNPCAAPPPSLEHLGSSARSHSNS